MHNAPLPFPALQSSPQGRARALCRTKETIRARTKNFQQEINPPDTHRNPKMPASFQENRLLRIQTKFSPRSRRGHVAFPRNLGSLINRNDFSILAPLPRNNYIATRADEHTDNTRHQFRARGTRTNYANLRGGSYKFCLLVARERGDLSRSGRQARYRGTMKGVECAQFAIYSPEVGRFDALRQDPAEREKRAR